MEQPMFEKILVPLDGSRLSEKALPYAVDLARKYGSELVLLRAVPRAAVQTGFGAESPHAIELMMDQARAVERQTLGRAKRYLTLKEQQLAGKLAKLTKKAVVGAAAQAILAECRRARVDLVVMTTRGRGGLHRALLGSVADEVVRSPLVPVLVVTPRRRVTRKARK
jgi:nucleotide-binding universal stress UspA family protein